MLQTRSRNLSISENRELLSNVLWSWSMVTSR